MIESSKLISKRGDIIKSVLEASFESYSLNALLDKIVRIGMKELDAKSCTIFLLEDDKETLRIKAGDGEIGKRLLEVNATYYVIQKRNSFKSMEEREKHVDKNLLDKKDDWRDENKWEYRKQMVDEGKLPMGITAYVVKENQHIILHGKEVKKHPEWIGAYEKNQGEECISIVEIPLTVHGKAVGVIKIENHKEREFFTNEHKRILSILADCVVLAMERLRYEPISYKGLFGTKLLEEIISLNNQNPQSKVEINQKIEEILRRFSVDIIERDIVGIDRIYKAVVETIKEINKELGFGEKFIKIIENIAEYEPLLGLDTREHFIHQFHVFLLGYYIINKNLQIKDKLKTHLEGNESDVIKCWFLASIFHDLGYTIEKMDEWLGGYFKNMFLAGNSNNNTKIIPYMFSWGDIFMIEDYASSKKMLIEFIGEKLLGKTLNKKCSDLCKTAETLLLLRQNHGIFSALILLNRLRLSTIDKKIGLNAALSIVLHAIWEEAYRLREGQVLEFQDFPFAFLLMFCDNAHQWGRPSIKSLLKKATDERKMIKVQLIGITVEDDKVECILEYSEVIKETEKIPRPQDYWRGKITNFSICYQAEGKVFWEQRF